MNVLSMVDTILDPGVLLGYGNVGLQVRQRLPGWPTDRHRLDGAVVTRSSSWPVCRLPAS